MSNVAAGFPPLTLAAPPAAVFWAVPPVVEGVGFALEELELLAEPFESLDEVAGLPVEEAVWILEDPPHAASTIAASTNAEAAVAGLHLLQTM